jgi:hypothetical protein
MPDKGVGLLALSGATRESNRYLTLWRPTLGTRNENTQSLITAVRDDPRKHGAIAGADLHPLLNARWRARDAF